MYNNFYDSLSGFRMAMKCDHKDKKLFALGICATCYHYKYSKTRVKRKLKNNLKKKKILLKK